MDTINLNSSEKETLTCRGYHLLSKIGEGAYAQVYLSSFKDSPIKLACKIVDVPKASATYVNKFLPRELNILMAIKSPYIVHIHSIFRRNLKYFIFMRYAENGDLMDWIIANGALSQTQSKKWTQQIVYGMQYLHKNYIAHRDIKCENILITANNNIKLTDFGFSRYIENEGTSKVPFSETFCGSLLYVAPEIVKGIAYNPFKSDMWSLGVVIFTMLNCKVPFNETNTSLIYEMQMSRKYRFKDRDPLMADARNLIKQLLQPEPKRRPSVDAVLEHKWLDHTYSDEEKPELKDLKTEKNSTVGNEANAPRMQEPAKISLEVIMPPDESLPGDMVKNKSEVCPPNEQANQEEVTEENVDDVKIGIQIISKTNADGH